MNQLEKQVAELNERLPVGSRVFYWRGVRGENTRRGAIRSPFTILGGHTVVGWITGCSGYIAATHIDADVGDPVFGAP